MYLFSSISDFLVLWNNTTLNLIVDRPDSIARAVGCSSLREFEPQMSDMSLTANGDIASFSLLLTFRFWFSPA
jgi:hypothetical protein